MKKFDYKNYWEKRHAKDIGNIKTVGLQSFSEKANRASYLLIEQQYDKLLNKIDISLKNKNVLDAGAGIGMYIPFFIKQRANVTAIDVSNDAVNYIRLKFPKVNCLTVCLEDIDKYFKPNQFYFIHCFDVLYHIMDDTEWEKAIRNLALVSNKYIALHEQFSTKKPIICSKHIKWRGREKIINELAKNNFYEVASIPTTVVRRLFTYKILNFFPNFYYKLDKFLLEKQFSVKVGGSFIKIFKKDHYLN